MTKKQLIYLAKLDISLNDTGECFGSLNISTIPYAMFYEIFKNQIVPGKKLFKDKDVYFLDERTYSICKDVLDSSISFGFDFSLFQYRVRLVCINMDDFPKDYYSELPPPLYNNTVEPLFYRVYLDVALITSVYEFGSVNISHIPYDKLTRVFRSQIPENETLFANGEGYMIDSDLYFENKVFFDESIPLRFDFDIFEYSINIVSLRADRYKKAYYEERPN